MKRVVVSLVLVILFMLSTFRISISAGAVDSSKRSEFSGVQFTGDSWSMFHHDQNHTGYSNSTAPNTNQTLWSYTTGDRGYSSPAVAYGMVYVGSYDNKTYALDATTGVSIWNYTTGGHVTSSPAVADGKVFIGSYDQKVYCLNATNRALIWSYRAYNFVESSPVVAGNRVYLGGGFDRRVYCLPENDPDGDKVINSTEVIWSHPTDDYVFSSPAVAHGRVYFGSNDGKVYALNAATGIFDWSYTTGGMVLSSPAVAYGRVYVSSYDNKTYALNATTGEFLWDYTTGGHMSSSPAVAYGMVYVGSDDNKTYALDAATGVKNWSYTTGGGVGSAPAVADGKVFVGSGDRRIHALNATTGVPIWSSTIGSSMSSPAVAGSRLYVGSWNKIYAFGAPIHDIAVTNVKTSRTVVSQGFTTNINVTVANQGNYPESFNVTLNRIGILTTTRTLKLNGSFQFGWNRSIPGPPITANLGDTINLTLESPHNIAYNFFVDYDGDKKPDLDEPTSPDFRNTTITYQFVAYKNGTFEYICDTYKDNMHGTFIVNPAFVATQKIGVQLVSPSLALSEARVMTFAWNTSGVPKGNYTISATADAVPGEANTVDNNITDGWITVAPWDLTGLTMWVPDGKCDIRDIARAATLFGAAIGDNRYDGRADLTGSVPLMPEGKIDIRDIALVAKHFGDTYL